MAETSVGAHRVREFRDGSSVLLTASRNLTCARDAVETLKSLGDSVVSTCGRKRGEKMAPTRVILMSCGSYNPPTNMHLRMFEIARDHLHRMGTHIVVGGVISPVHDAYAKKELASSTHRCAMLRLALQNSDWIRLSTWETRQNCWTKTRLSLQHHQNLLNAVLFDTNDIKRRMQIEDLDWIPENIKNSNDTTPIQIKLLCGADLLESFGTCDLWAEEDIDAIVGEHGLVVITREGSNPNKFIYDSDILSRHMHNIYIVTEWIPNEVSSSRIRRALKRGESVRYLLQDSVIDYIYKTGIYDAKATTTTTIKLELTSPNANNYLTIDPKYQSTFLTPSPSDVTMESPSPVEIISIDVPDAVLRKNMQNAAPRHCALEEAREKFINAIVAENGNAKHLAGAKAAYPGQAKQIIATESGESRILDEVGPVDEEKKVAKVQPRQLRADVDDESGADVDDESGADVDESGADVDRSGPPGKSDTSADDKQGTPDARRECALSDFSVDKAEYGMREGGALNEEDFDDLTVDEEWRETQERMMKEFAGDGRKNGRNGGVERADVLDDSFGDVSESLSSSRVLLLVGEGSGGEDGAGLDLVDRREGTEFDLIDRREEGTELHLMGRREEGAELHLIDRREEGVGLDLINGREDGAGFDLIDRREDGAGLNLIDRREDRAGFDLIDRREDGAGLNLIDRREDGAGLDLIDRREDGAGFNLVDRREDRAGFDLFDQREDGAGMDLTDRRGDGAELSLINVREEGAGMDLIVRREDGAGLDLIDRREDGAGLDLIVGREERVDLIVGREERVDLIVERQSELTVESEDLVDLIVHQKNHVDFIVEREEPVDIILQRTEQVGLIVDKEDRVDLIVQRKERVDVIVKQNDYTGMIVEREDPVDIVLRRKDFAGVIVERKDPTDLIVRRTDPVDLFVQRRDPVDSIVQRKDAIDLIAHHKDPVDLVVQRKDPVDLIVQRKDPVDLIVQRKDPVESTVQRKNPVDPIVERKDPLDSAVSIVQRKNLVDPTVHGKEPVTSIVQRSPSKDHAAILREQDLLTAIKKATPTHEPEKAAKSSVCKFSPVEESLEPSSSVSDDNTSVKAQSVIDAELLSAKDDFSPDPEELEPSAGDVLPKRDSNLEIDGKYLKSIVNSRKSPRKTKGGQLRAFSDDNVRRSTSGSQDQSSRSEPKTSSVTKTKSDRFEMEKFRSTNEEATRTRVPVSSRIQELAEECDARKIQRYGPLKGSLDSVMTVSETRIIPRRKPKAAKEAFSKKSKSYESFKRVQEAFVEEPLKADSSASQLITANPLDAQTDEFCSVCCYVNQLAMRAEHDEVGSPNQETFYTLQSNCSSLLDEDSTECDICSSWNLQESSTEALDRKIMTAPADEEALYEVCEICGELGAAYDPNQDVLEPPEYVDNRITPPAGLIKSNKDLRFVDECLTDAYVDEDSFEIENCGFQSGTESMEDRGHFPSEDDLIDDLGKDSRPFYLRTASHTPPTRDKHPRDKYFIPKDEVALSNSGGAKKIGRKGSLLKKKIDDTLNAAQDKRRYSSADNLQVAKVFAKGSDKFVRSKGAKLIGSADNIRTSRSSRRCKSLQRSADNVRYIDSSTDNLDSLAESLGKENEFDGSIDWTDRPKVRDNETVKMILTKHGIKIISEKETAL